MSYKFAAGKYSTCGIAMEVPLITQMYLWNLIAELRREMELDYLQVFELSIKDGKQHIIHKQEIPYYKKEHTLETVPPITGKIFVIDDIEYATMTFNFEY